MDTDRPRLVPLLDDETAPESEDKPSIWRRRRWLWIGLSAFVGLLGITAVVMAFVTIPYFALSPGSVRNTADAIIVEGTETYDPEGEIGFTTVSLSDNINLWQWVNAELDPAIDVVHEREIRGDRTPEQQRELTEQQMVESQDTATLVALDWLGYDLGGICGAGIEVGEIQEGFAVGDVVETGDVIIGIDGVELQQSGALVDEIRARAPGDEIVLSVQRADSDDVEEVTVVLGENPQDSGVAMLGVQIGDLPPEVAEIPFEVQIDTGRVGGPSAGLAFTLAVIDLLSPGELTGGASVATTGTIRCDGTVGPVGGVAQKAVAAERNGVELFLVPSSEYDEAITHAGDMRVEIADTIDEAMEALDSIGGNALAIERSGDGAA